MHCQNDEEECATSGLKQCPFCLNVMKSQCSKAQCRIAVGGKPVMMTVALKGNQKKSKKQIPRRPNTVPDLWYGL